MLRPVGMRRLAIAIGLLALGAASLDCESDAKGVDACRTIETHRCNISRDCSFSGIQTDSDVKVCELFYRDQCLYGIDNDATVPDAPAIDACLAALDQAAACKSTKWSECADQPAISEEASVDDVGCTLLARPEELEDCAFLRPVPEEPSEGGQGGTAEEGGTGGVGGMGGAAGAGGTTM